uniref:Uncharacterized protein n=1 Tax=Timema bartmani TaxID=61472 RepID=A0A7R9I828_9NEOP|nr:unnamed protein product [Timema bartmani]
MRIGLSRTYYTNLCVLCTSLAEAIRAPTAISTGTKLADMQGSTLIVRSIPIPAPTKMPVGPYTLSIQPGNGSLGKQLSALKICSSGLPADELLQNGVSYPKKCYKDLTNKTCIERTEINCKNELKHAASVTNMGAFISFLSSSESKTSIALVPPLKSLVPTEFDTLCLGLIIARAIATHAMGLESLNVVTLDVQEYDMAMKLWMERPGELQIAFWALVALELNLKKCIEPYELGVLQRSLNASDGCRLLAYYRTWILHHLVKMSSDVRQNETARCDPSDNQEMNLPLEETTIEHAVETTNESSVYQVGYTAIALSIFLKGRLRYVFHITKVFATFIVRLKMDPYEMECNCIKQLLMETEDTV